MRDEVHVAAMANELEPIDDGRGVGFGVAMISVRPKAFTDDNVFQSVAIHVHEIERMELGEMHAVTVLLGLLAHDQMLAKSDLAARAHLLPPREPVAMRRNAADDVRQAVAI